MLISFEIINFRSIREKLIFSMEAGPSGLRADNFFRVPSKHSTKSEDMKLLKAAVIFGPNASGKSNFFKALEALVSLITEPQPIGRSLPAYQPFLFDADTRNAPIQFKLAFLGPESVKYVYEVHFTEKTIGFEKLEYYPNGWPKLLYQRDAQENGNANIHHVKIGSSVKIGQTEKQALANQTYLSRFGSSLPHELFTKIYLVFQRLVLVHPQDKPREEQLSRLVKDTLAKNPALKKRLEELIWFSDTGIRALSIGNDNTLLGDHAVFTKGSETDSISSIPFEEESLGSNILLVLGCSLLKTLETGGAFIADEMSNNLHTALTRFLVELFRDPMSNPHNAQLIFTTHDVALLGEAFRSDQIWMAEKDKTGSTRMFSAFDFDGVREDSTNFEIWYRTGKFGARPHIKSQAFIHEDEVPRGFRLVARKL